MKQRSIPIRGLALAAAAMLLLGWVSPGAARTAYAQGSTQAQLDLGQLFRFPDFTALQEALQGGGQATTPAQPTQPETPPEPQPPEDPAPAQNPPQPEPQPEEEPAGVSDRQPEEEASRPETPEEEAPPEQEEPAQPEQPGPADLEQIEDDPYTDIYPDPREEVVGENFLPEVEEELLQLHNAERERQGLEPLRYNETLSRAARYRCKEMYENGYFDHLRPDGSKWSTVLAEEFPLSFLVAGENLCMVTYEQNGYGHFPAQRWFDLWVESPEHYENILYPDFTDVGFGVYFQEVDGQYIAYATALFAQLE